MEQLIGMAFGIIITSITFVIYFKLYQKFSRLQQNLEHIQQDMYRHIEYHERNVNDRIESIYRNLADMEHRFEKCDIQHQSNSTKQQLNG